MIRFFFLSLFLLAVGVIVQQWMPAMGIVFYDARILIIPLIFFCIAHSQPYILTLIFAVIAGVLWDAQNVIQPFVNTTERQLDSVENLRFGYSVLLFGMLGFFIKYIQANLKYYGMIIYVVTIFLSFVIYLLLENLFLLFVRGTWAHDYRFIHQIFYTALFSTLFSPLLLYVLGTIWNLFKLKKRGLGIGYKTLLRRKY